VAWTAALRERLLALAGRPLLPLAPGLPKPEPKPERAPQGRRAASVWTEITYEATEADWMVDWPELAKPLRLGPGGVAHAARMIADKSDREVVTHICDYLQRAAAQLGAEADVARIAALQAAALALCPDADDAGDRPADPGAARAAPAEPAGSEPVGSDPAGSAEAAEDDPPPRKPPDG
jgi:hypothetical protein